MSIMLIYRKIFNGTVMGFYPEELDEKPKEDPFKELKKLIQPGFRIR